MFRKLTLGLIAAASLGAAALAPSAASAHGFGWHGGWHGGFGHHGFYGGPTLYVGGLNDDCMQRRVIETRRGTRVRWVNVCAF
ncbi:MAG: hypothetical protein JWR89_5187 [Tardiphaga sp.]|jgi:hypothetical protein|uniref:hypothetical protein n=1 Tax=Tardiphaga sp. TaxID=1926292 RepID=UPI002616244D|nr:hypothetical protein [Tardiphaga sp.]MDB5505285.1 hypothetical protein [Tardiphaga sp.]